MYGKALNRVNNDCNTIQAGSVSTVTRRRLKYSGLILDRGQLLCSPLDGSCSPHGDFALLSKRDREGEEHRNEVNLCRQTRSHIMTVINWAI